MKTTKAPPQVGPMYVQAKGPIQPITLAEPSFLYQLDAPFDEGGINLWGGGLNVHNGHSPEHLQKALKLMLAAEEMLDALEHAEAWFQASNLENLPVGMQIRAAIAKAGG